MTYSSTNTHEVKRESIRFSDNLSTGLSKPDRKFVQDILYGLARSQSVLISDIARALQEAIKLSYTIDRLSCHLGSFDEDAMRILKDNFSRMVLKYIDKNPIVLIDDSEMIKRYGKMLEDLCMVRDASSPKDDIYPGYHVCEATVLTRKQKQPISLYSHIYSTVSEGFKSKNDETLKSILYIKSIIKERCTFVFDRGYDANLYYDFFLEENENRDDFIIRMKETRNLIFKGKLKKVGDVVKRRKGKIRMSMYFSDENKEAYVSHTRVELPSHKGKMVNLVIVYGLSEEKPMILLTNKEIRDKHDVHNIVRTYMKRWRIEENFRFKKQKYGFENMRVRTLKAMNTLNTLLMMHIGHIGMLAEKIDSNLLVIKIIESARSLKNRAYLWFYMISDGIYEILKYAKAGIKEFQRIRKKKGYEQLQLKLW